MSFILDALRKVNQENRPPGEVIPPVVAIEKLRKERRNRRRQLAAMSAIGVVSAAATAILLRRPPTREAARPSAPVHQAAAVEPAVETPVESPVVETQLPRSDVVVGKRAPDPPPVERAAPPESGTPTAKPPSEPPRLVLQGTSVLAGRPVAVVSDRRVFEGDIIEGALVIRIEERSVELEFEGRRFTLTL